MIMCSRTGPIHGRACVCRIRGAHSKTQYTQAGRQIMPSDEGLVKAMLTSLFRSDLDFMKSANLAGHMTTNLWKETQRNTTQPENVAQIAISILISASAC